MVETTDPVMKNTVTQVNPFDASGDQKFQTGFYRKVIRDGVESFAPVTVMVHRNTHTSQYYFYLSRKQLPEVFVVGYAQGRRIIEFLEYLNKTASPEGGSGEERGESGVQK